MKKLCLLFVFCSLFAFAACGSDSKNDSETTHDESNINDAEEVADDEGGTENPDTDQGRKQGELYGECYPNETCNKGLVCDVENNICIKDPDYQNNDNDIVPADDSEKTQDEDSDLNDSEEISDTDLNSNDADETHDEDADNDSEETPDEDADADTDTNECAYNEEDPSQNKSCDEGVLTTCTEENFLESAECELGLGCKDDGSDCAECQNENSICTNNAAQIGSFRSCSNGTWSEEKTCLNSFSCDPNNTGCGECRNELYKCTNGSNDVGKYQVCTNGLWPASNVTCPNNYSCKSPNASSIIGVSQADVCGVCKNSTYKCTNESNGIGRYQVCTNGLWLSTSTICPNNYSCKGASIIGTSTATVCGECLNGSKRCVGNTAFQFCVSGAWSSSTNCQSGSSCQNGECVQQ